MRRLLSLLVPLVLVLAACGGDDAGSGDGGSDPARLMPADAVFYVEAVVRPDGELESDVEALAAKVLRTDDPGARIRELIDDAMRDERPNASFEEDIDPWLGDRVGITGINLAAEEPNFVGAIAIKDAEAARAFIEQDTGGGEERSYEGTDYVLDDDDTYVGVIEDEFVGLADTDAGFKRLVDAAKGRGLAEVERFSSAMENLPDERMGALWVDPRAAIELAKASPNADAAAIGVLEQSVGSIPPITAALLADEDSATIESVARVAEGGDTPGLDALGEPPELLQQVPADATAALGIAQVGETVRTGLESVAGGLGSAVLGGQLEQQLGLDLERDVLGWMGDAALYVSGDALADLGGALIVQATDAELAEAALPRIVGAALRGLGAPFEPADVPGAEQAFAAPLQGGPGPLVLARSGDRVVLALGEQAAVAALDPEETIADSGLHERAAEALDGLAPVLVVDGESLAALISDAAALEPGFAQVEPYLELLDLAAAGGERDGDTVRQRFTVKVK